MAATKLAFLTQPLNTTSGYTIQAQAFDSPNLRENHGLRVAAQDSNGNIVTTDTSSVTIAIASGTGTLSGTLTQPVVNGIATFSDLAIAGSGAFTLTATDGALTAATTNTFTLTAVNRINPYAINGTITTGGGIGVGGVVGPFRFRPGTLMHDVAIYVTSTQGTDTVNIYTTNPGVTLSASTGSPGAAGIGVPSIELLDLPRVDQDVYVVGNTVTGTISVSLRAVKSEDRV